MGIMFLLGKLLLLLQKVPEYRCSFTFSWRKLVPYSRQIFCIDTWKISPASFLPQECIPIMLDSSVIRRSWAAAGLPSLHKIRGFWGTCRGTLPCYSPARNWEEKSSCCCRVMPVWGRYGKPFPTAPQPTRDRKEWSSCYSPCLPQIGITVLWQGRSG